MLNRAFLLPTASILALALVACGPDKTTKTDPEPVTATKLEIAKQFASEIYTATSGIQELIADDGPLDQLEGDLNVAANVYDTSLEDALSTIAVASVAVIDISLRAFTDWDGYLENAPSGYDIDYTQLHSSYDLLNEDLTLLEELLSSESELGDMSLTAGTVTWNSATKRMVTDLQLTNSEGQTTNFESVAELPASMNSNKLTFKLISAELSNSHTNLAFDQQPAVLVAVDFYETIQLNSGNYVDFDDIDNPYLKLKSIAITTSTMNLDMTGGIRDVHFDGKGDITLVRTQATHDVEGYLTLPTDISLSGNFEFGDTKASGSFDFTLVNADDVYLSEYTNELLNLDGATMSLSFSTEFQASAQSPIIGISSTIKDLDIGGSIDELDEEDYSNITQAMQLKYNQKTYNVTMDEVTEEITISNSTGNVALYLSMDSETSTLGNIKVDAIKQADIVENDSDIEAVFIDGTKQVLTTFN